MVHLKERKFVTDTQLDEVEPMAMLTPVGKKFFPVMVIEPPPRVSLEPYLTPSKTGVS
jgi:hypothetical protein